ncbi:MAG TPA: HNH endonuclease family protein, partial [Allocoleopsis sp.]
YILCKLEADASHIDVNEDSFSIEHILPESPGEDWQKNFTDAQIEEMIYRIGNLTPLEPTLNRQVGNELYPSKQAAYQQSVYMLTRSIVVEEWTPNTIATRQKHLAQRAVHIWKADFAG